MPAGSTAASGARCATIVLHGESGRAAAPHGPALREAKLALRRELLAARDALPEATRAAAAAAIVARLAALPRSPRRAACC